MASGSLDLCKKEKTLKLFFNQSSLFERGEIIPQHLTNLLQIVAICTVQIVGGNAGPHLWIKELDFVIGNYIDAPAHEHTPADLIASSEHVSPSERRERAPRNPK
jgi:hypothetical protein